MAGGRWREKGGKRGRDHRTEKRGKLKAHRRRGGNKIGREGKEKIRRSSYLKRLKNNRGRIRRYQN